MPKEPLSANDHLPARDSKAYAKDKLHIVGQYQDIFAKGMKQWPERTYVDLMAGPGICRIEDTGEEFPGSPIRSEFAPFTRRIFVEEAPSLAAALTARATSNPIVLAGDCNDAATIDRIRAAVPVNGISLVFVDNLGTECRFDTLARISEGRRAMDLLIVFQVGDLTRNVIDAVEGRDDRTRLDAFFGSLGWEQVVRDLQQFNAGSAEIAVALMNYYQQRMESIGYRYSAESVAVMKNEKNVPLYRLLLLSKHPKAIEFFRKIQKISPLGQRLLDL